MWRDAFPIRDALLDSTRFSRLTERATDGDRADALEIVWLLGLGVAAAAATCALDFGLRIPGHAILRTAPLVALGLATVPRRTGGWLIGVGSVLGLLGVRLAGGALPGLGTGTGLVLIGPMLEWALRGARNGWGVYLSFVLAGTASNLAAFAIRATPKVLGMEASRGQPLSAWITWALFTYTVCGLLAGLVSAIICFRAGGGAQVAAAGNSSHSHSEASR